MPAIIGSVVGTILSFPEKTIGFVSEHTWTLIVFVAGLMSSASSDYVLKAFSLVFSYSFLGPCGKPQHIFGTENNRFIKLSASAGTYSIDDFN